MPASGWTWRVCLKVWKSCMCSYLLTSCAGLLLLLQSRSWLMSMGRRWHRYHLAVFTYHLSVRHPTVTDLLCFLRTMRHTFLLLCGWTAKPLNVRSYFLYSVFLNIWSFLLACHNIETAVCNSVVVCSCIFSCQHCSPESAGDWNYRVAQNKIPHQTICNIFATSG